MTIDFSLENPLENVFPVSEFDRKVLTFLEEFLSGSKTVSVQTSGSTGIPKIFEIKKSKMRNSAKMTCDFLGLKKGNSALLCLPVEYISGKMMVVRSIQSSLKLLVEEPSLSPLKNLETEIDFCAMTPLQVENSLDKIHLIKKLIIGGATVSESLKNKIFQHLESSPNTKHQTPNTKIYETYGMSETLSHIALREVYPNGERYFNVFDGIGISTDERGCLVIDAPQLNPEILSTNDLVEIKSVGSDDTEKKEFRFLGRIDNVINSGGAKIFPEELEAVVKKEFPNEVAFLGLPSEKFGEELVLAVEIEYKVGLHEYLSQISFEKSFHKPKEIFFVQEFPRTPNGKINRTALRALIEEEK